MAAAPASWTIFASVGAFRSPSFQPARIFTVTGIFTAFAIAAITAGRVRRLAHQAAAGVVLGDLRHRAAHVHVDDVGAHAFDDLRRRGHLLGIAAEDLDGDRPLFFRVLGVLERPIDAADEALGAHHLGDDQPAAAVPLDQAAERRVGHAGHRGDGERRRKVDGADFHVVLEDSRTFTDRPEGRHRTTR